MSQKLIPLLACILLYTNIILAQENPVEELVDANLPIAPPTNDAVTGFSTDLLFTSDSELEKSFVISLLMIIVSEIGDKTFLIAAIMAMKHSRLVVFAAAFSSLAIMSVLSAVLGHVVPNLIPKQYTDVCASLLFLCFGVRMMYEAYHMDDNDNEEMMEVENELKTVEDRERANKMEEMEVGGLEATESAISTASKPERAKEGLMNLMQLVFSPVFNVYYVTAGVVIGHGMCTAVAVVGGRMLASKISVRTGKYLYCLFIYIFIIYTWGFYYLVTFAGSILFLIFGVFYSFNAYHGLQE
ncbi:hypothetical protein INT48_004026 [Thamnidium elegans]|uniref:GDT1 family protein n=1 Tax=Thamnidium elegans TaxID=101142 RepID=A0A8H7SJD9_9FUNG|nr:hypothetical protein INT48_004026 [Thamnidium elegans]